MLNLTKEELGVHVRPLGYRVLLKAPKIAEKSQGGIILVNDHREHFEKNFAVGKVLAYGDSAFSGSATAEFKVEPGTWVNYSKYEREPLHLQDGTLCYYINDDRLLGVLNAEDLPKFGAVIECQTKTA